MAYNDVELDCVDEIYYMLLLFEEIRTQNKDK